MDERKKLVARDTSGFFPRTSLSVLRQMAIRTALSASPLRSGAFNDVPLQTYAADVAPDQSRRGALTEMRVADKIDR
jgi:hypothetical protein